MDLSVSELRLLKIGHFNRKLSLLVKTCPFLVKNFLFAVQNGIFLSKLVNILWKIADFNHKMTFFEVKPFWTRRFSTEIGKFWCKNITLRFFAENNVQSWSCLRFCPVDFFFLECCAPINILKCNYLRFFLSFGSKYSSLMTRSWWLKWTLKYELAILNINWLFDRSILKSDRSINPTRRRTAATLSENAKLTKI